MSAPAAHHTKRKKRTTFKLKEYKADKDCKGKKKYKHRGS